MLTSQEEYLKKIHHPITISVNKNYVAKMCGYTSFNRAISDIISKSQTPEEAALSVAKFMDKVLDIQLSK